MGALLAIQTMATLMISNPADLSSNGRVEGFCRNLGSFCNTQNPLAGLPIPFPLSSCFFLQFLLNHVQKLCTRPYKKLSLSVSELLKSSLRLLSELRTLISIFLILYKLSLTIQGRGEGSVFGLCNWTFLTYHKFFRASDH